MQNEFSHIKTLAEYLDNFSPTNELSLTLINPNITIYLDNALDLKVIYHNFFISSEISGKILKSTNYTGIYILIHEYEEKQSDIYLVGFKDYNIMLAYHYLFVLQQDITDYQALNQEKEIIFSQKVLDAYQEQVQAFEKKCFQFKEISKDEHISTYEYIGFFTYILSSYSGIRGTLLGNAESRKDSLYSHNFLLSRQKAPYSNYARESSYIIEGYEQYLLHLMIYDDKKNYSLQLTGSCMSSINLILLHWLTEKKQHILVLGTPFHETSRLVESYFEKHSIFHIDMHELESEKMTTIMTQTPPDAIIIDVSSPEFKPQVCNKEIFGKLIHQLKKHNNRADILLDVTAKYLFLNSYISDINNNLYFVGSLSKYLYKGVDLGFGGYTIYPKYQAEDLSLLRQNTGSIISHHDALKIPIIPQSTHLHIAETLGQKLQEIDTLLCQKTSPKELSLYFSNAQKHEEEFCGSYIHIGYSRVEDSKYIEQNREKIIEMIIIIAKKQNIDIAYGISYGYTHTRFTCLSTPQFESIENISQSYIRMSVGYTSQTKDIITLIGVIQKILLSFIK